MKDNALIPLEAICINPGPDFGYCLELGKTYQVFEYTGISEHYYLVNLFELKEPKAESMPRFRKDRFKLKHN